MLCESTGNDFQGDPRRGPFGAPPCPGCPWDGRCLLGIRYSEALPGPEGNVYSVLYVSNPCRYATKGLRENSTSGTLCISISGVGLLVNVPEFPMRATRPLRATSRAFPAYSQGWGSRNGSSLENRKSEDWGRGTGWMGPSEGLLG